MSKSQKLQYEEQTKSADKGKMYLYLKAASCFNHSKVKSKTRVPHP